MEVSQIAQLATFQVEVETQGYVGFGISKKGTMEGADIVAAEIGSNGEILFNVIYFRNSGYKTVNAEESEQKINNSGC